MSNNLTAPDPAVKNRSFSKNRQKKQKVKKNKTGGVYFTNFFYKKKL